MDCCFSLVTGIRISLFADGCDIDCTLRLYVKYEDNRHGSVLNHSGAEEPEGNSLLPSSQNELLNKLRAVMFEIDAVASVVEQVDEVAAESEVHGLHSGSVLHHALATDRLKSLKKRKAQLEKELTGLPGQSVSGSSADRGNLLRHLVKEEPSLKRKLKDIQKPSKREGKKVKVVSFHEDTDFDAVFDAASAGFVETVREAVFKDLIYFT